MTSQTPAAPPAALAPEAGQLKNARNAAASGFVGTTLEYYDFYIFATAAALYLQPLFFPAEGGAGQILALATVGVSYVTRPLGAIMWGWLGDVVGRKKALMACIVLMGVATFIIGLVPTYETIGLWAPIIIVLMRLFQGLSAGGESPGSASLSMETAPDHRRGFYASWTIAGATAGLVLSSAIFIPLNLLPEEFMMSFGWRIPFLLSILVTVVTVFMRARLQEPEVFEEVKEHRETVKVPLFYLLKNYPLQMLRVAGMALFLLMVGLFSTFSLAYGTQVAGISNSEMLALITVSNLGTLVMVPILGHLSDKVGRKPVFISGCIGMIVLVIAYFGALAHAGPGNTWLVWILGILLMSFAYAAANGIYPVYFPEQFPAQVRYSGMAISLMLGLVIAGFSPAIAQTINGETNNWIGVSLFAAGGIAISALCALFSPETAKIPTADLGAKKK
ncbi:MFS transporter (plasmid) [Citricoccus sp. SGAir0253]|uniref:MFS transporter n=1 Tax=Citricoccus sp. SGAir0253 TaxID=2567881 RepID=UPI0010CD1A72|nr:MFS transporter [Citricoccus sp. SGAir0253]QCU79561.1 MFS transporter [Citricoccus sp. SGAir0253]